MQNTLKEFEITCDTLDEIEPSFQPDMFKTSCFDYCSYAVSTNTITSDYLNFCVCESNDITFRILPDACTLLILDLSAFTGLLLNCAESISTLNLEAGHQYFIIRFYPGMVSSYFNVCMEDLLISPLHLNEILPTHLCTTLMMNIQKANTFDCKISAIEDFILKRHSECGSQKNIILFLRNQIIVTSGTVNINDLCAHSGYSVRYIRDLFHEYIGISPKSLCEILKFQKSFTISCSSDKKQGEIATLCGYYDQSQMNRAYKKIVGMPPLKLRCMFY